MNRTPTLVRPAANRGIVLHAVLNSVIDAVINAVLHSGYTRLHLIRVRDHAVFGGRGFVLGEEAADVFDFGGSRGDGDAHVAGAGELLAGGVTILVVGNVAVVGRHGEFLVDDAVLLLLAVEMVVALEKDADLMLHHQLVDRELPARALLLEGAFALLALAAPFVEIGLVDAAASGAEDVVGEDELVLRLAGLERALEPLILSVADCDAPPVAVLLIGALLFLASLPPKPLSTSDGECQ